MAKKEEKLTKESVVNALQEIGIEKKGKEENFTVLVADAHIEVHRNNEAYLKDDFSKRDVTPKEYAEFVVELVKGLR